jgi:hypothetical protein
VIVSAALAAFFQIGVGAAGLGKIGTVYGSGEELGFGNPHDIALLCSCVAAAALGMELPYLTRLATAALGAVAALITGVRSGLLGLALAAVVWIGVGRLRPSRLVIVAGVVTAIFFSGAANVVLNRLHASERKGEFNTVATAGSGRGGIWTHTLAYFFHSGPLTWAVGAGLRSTTQITQATINSSTVAQNDLIGIVVELGLIGLVGFVLLWIILVRGATNRLPLIALGAFGFANGSIEYLAPLVIALLLSTGALRARTHPVPVTAGIKVPQWDG